MSIGDKSIISFKNKDIINVYIPKEQGNGGINSTKFDVSFDFIQFHWSWTQEWRRCMYTPTGYDKKQKMKWAKPILMLKLLFYLKDDVFF